MSWEACNAGGTGHRNSELHAEACRAGGPKNTCRCTWKLGQAQIPDVKTTYTLERPGHASRPLKWHEQPATLEALIIEIQWDSIAVPKQGNKTSTLAPTRSRAELQSMDLKSNVLAESGVSW